MDREVGVATHDRGPPGRLEHVLATLDVRPVLAHDEATDPTLDQHPGDPGGHGAPHRPIRARDTQPPVGSRLQQRLDPTVASGRQGEGHERIVIT